MELKEYVNKKVKVELTNGYYYEGLVLSSGEDYIKIRDKFDKLVLIRINFIGSIVEVEG